MTRLVPAEWAPHQAMWLGFPSHADLWQEDLEPAQEEVAALARALATDGGETVRLLIHGEEAMAAARDLLGDVDGIEFVEGAFGDIWLRDTGPLFIDVAGKLSAIGYATNGWGGKYDLPDDAGVNAHLAKVAGLPLERHELVMEGGALEHDGKGTILTTRQCLLNENRNPDLSQAEIEAALVKSLGAKKFLWLEDGLLNDHTDGHIDNLARFVAPGVVACPMAFGTDDPNADLYGEVAKALSDMTDADGQKLKVVRIPSPGLVTDEDGEVIPASHMNFLIANKAVLVPTYGTDSADIAVEVLSGLFPDHKVIGLSSSAILTGGGSFHCISQQEPVV